MRVAVVGLGSRRGRVARGLGFDPAAFSSRGRASCLICGAAVDARYVKEQGLAGRMGITPLAAVLVKESGRDATTCRSAPTRGVSCGLRGGARRTGRLAHLTSPFRPMTRWNFWTPQYGLSRFRDLFTPRQLATLCAFAQGVSRGSRAKCLTTEWSLSGRRRSAHISRSSLDRVADRCSTLVGVGP